MRGRVGTRIGEETSERNYIGQGDSKITTQDNPLDEQKTRKLKTSSVVVSEGPRQKRREPRNGNQQKKVRGEESLSVQNDQRKE